MKNPKKLWFASLCLTSCLWGQRLPPHYDMAEQFQGSFGSSDNERIIKFRNYGCKNFEIIIYCSNRWVVSLISPNGKDELKVNFKPDPFHSGKAYIDASELGEANTPPSTGTWSLNFIRRKNFPKSEFFEGGVIFKDSRFEVLTLTEPSVYESTFLGDTVTVHLKPVEILNPETSETRALSGAKIIARLVWLDAKKIRNKIETPLTFIETSSGSGDYISCIKLDKIGHWAVRAKVEVPIPGGGNFIRSTEVGILINKK